MFYLLNSRHILAPVTTREGLFGNPYVLGAIALGVVLQLLYTHAAPMQAVFGSTDLDAAQWGRVVAAGAAVFVIAELEKLIVRNSRFLPTSIPA